MRQILNLEKDINFMGLTKPMTVVSTVLLILSLALVGVRGLNFGLDFTGGTLIEVGFSDPTDPAQVRLQLEEAGFERTTVQNFGSSREVLVRMPPVQSDQAELVGQQVSQALQSKADSQVEIRRIEFVGPNVGKELTEQALLAMLVALLCILAYVSFRFEWRLSVGAVAALFHDVVLTFGFFALTQMEFNLTTVAGILSVIGYSLNDTIVVFDRIRENFRRIRKGGATEVVNTSLTQTLSRTIITTLTTLAVLVALFFAGGTMMKSFSAALLVGVGVGVYSSIYVATAVALKLGLNRESLLPAQVEKEGADQPSLI